MSFIEDIIVNVVPGQATAAREGFNPAVVSLTGQRSVLIHGSGVSGLVAKSDVRNAAVTLEIVVSGASFIYLVGTNDVHITVPTGTTVRGIISDFDTNVDPEAVQARALINLEALTTGSGLVTALAVTALAFNPYFAVQNISQLQYYFDPTDAAYVMIQNYLATPGHTQNIYLIDAFGLTDATLRTRIGLYDHGDWIVLMADTVTEARQAEITTYVDGVDRVAIFTSTDKTILQRVKSSHVAFLIHDAATSHPESSWAAKGLAVATPGANNWKFIKDLQGQLPNSAATLTDLIDVRTANGQSYVSEHGFNLVDNNKMVTIDGSALSIMSVLSRFWVKFNLTADLLELLVNASAVNSKVPYTDGGIAQVVGVISRRLTLAGTLGLIAPVSTSDDAANSSDGKYKFRITAPTYAQIVANTPANITAGILAGISFTYVEAGSIDIINPVNGYVVLSL